MILLGARTLGALSWALAALLRHRGPSASSLACCAGALWAALGYFHGEAAVGDWSAVMDTERAIFGAAAALLAGTPLLNMAAHLRTVRKKGAH